ncbi:hypothetical protein OHO83_09740 [Streptomyces sp. NBC_00569]|uniref:hypothetical protein n=1 Tax=unclassified Streptomyces TaxID=2593676 RepID=UPI00225529CC|nr:MULTISPECIES: hypothetical protein [unclassified Streptomyces]MCX5441136.1 hypothetical protein [Streptomyces sp. NBC_00063]WUB92563.1 hypothetical protein OHO83_09740 [Streptomyces sp. NBC_00569]
MVSYSDLQKAVRVEKFRIWLVWICGMVMFLIVGRAVDGLGVVGAVVQVALAVAWGPLAMAAVRMVSALKRRAKEARREALGDDYPG